jgi:L-serine dehydratase
MNGKIHQVSLSMDPNGSLATTHESQGSDMGLMGGLPGWDATDDRLPDAPYHLARNDVSLSFEIRDIAAVHPNTYHLVLQRPKGSCELTTLSTGGGMIEITEIDGHKLSIRGDYHEILIYCADNKNIIQVIGDRLMYEDMAVHSGDKTMLQIRLPNPPDRTMFHELAEMKDVRLVRYLRPVLPVLSRKFMEVPFLTSREMLEFNRDRELSLWELALLYESRRTGIPEEEVFEKMTMLCGYMEKAVSTVIRGTRYTDRILPARSPMFKDQMDRGQLLGGNLANRVEAPCLGKNVMAAMHALSCAYMALAGHEELIPLDEVIQTMKEVGASLPRSLRCTALGGLSITPAAG